MKRIGLAALALILSLAAPAWAADWTVDTGKSRLGFSLPWGNEPYVARFKSWKAQIAFDPADLAHAHVVASIDTASLDSGDSDTDESVTGDRGFDSGRIATAKFETKSFRHVAGDQYEAEGTLSVRGITKPLRLPFTLAIAGASAHMTGSAQIRWADFGMGQNMGAQLPNLGPLVTITVDLTATKR